MKKNNIESSKIKENQDYTEAVEVTFKDIENQAYTDIEKMSGKTEEEDPVLYSLMYRSWLTGYRRCLDAQSSDFTGWKNDAI